MYTFAIAQIIKIIGMLLLINPDVTAMEDQSYLLNATGETLCFEDSFCGEPTADLNTDGSFIFQSDTGLIVVGCLDAKRGCKPVEVVEEISEYWQLDSYSTNGDWVICQHDDTVIVSRMEPIYGYTWTDTQDDPCTITNHSTGETYTVTSDTDAWCIYDVEPGIEYTVTVLHFGKPVSMTFIAADHDEEYNPQ